MDDRDQLVATSFMLLLMGLLAPVAGVLLVVGAIAGVGISVTAWLVYLAITTLF